MVEEKFSELENGTEEFTRAAEKGMAERMFWNLHFSYQFIASQLHIYPAILSLCEQMEFAKALPLHSEHDVELSL